MKNQKSKDKQQALMLNMTMEGTRATLDVSGSIGWDTQAVEFTDKVQAAKDAGCTALLIRINSVGGYCYDGLAMGDCLENCGMETTGMVVGTAQSMANYLLQCCNIRVAHKNATLMFHQPSAGAWGTVDEIAEQARHLTQMRDAMFAKMAERCGVTGSELSAEHQTMKIYTASEALAHGFLDRIEGGEETTETDREESSQPATAKGCLMYDNPRQLMAMLGDTDEEHEEQDEDGDKKDEPSAQEDQEKDADSEDTEEEISDADADKDGKDAAKDAAPITRAEMRTLLARERAFTLAAMGASAAGLPAATGAAATPRRMLTMEEIVRLPSMQRLAYLDEHPEQREAYLRG